MRKVLLLNALFTFFFSVLNLFETNAQSCCPEFELNFARFTCETPDCKRNTAGQPGADAFTMCQYSTNKIQVIPGITPGFTYAWTVTGGTINGPVLTTFSSALPYIDVVWGGGNLGTVTVTIYNSDSSCFKVLKQNFCLTKSPKALFVKSTGDTVCKNQPVLFTNTSLGVFTTWTWNFGDGVTQNGGMSVSHAYANTGTYIVSLTVSNAKDSGNCGCSNTFYDTITVSNATGLSITTPDCKKMHCAGDTVTYCASITGCASYNWSALGGTVIGSGNCIKVVWNNLTPSIINPTVTLTIPPACAGTCGNTANFIEKILYNGMPIQGSSPVCVNAASTYTLPSLPGVFYTWTVTPNTGVTITNGTSINTPAFGLTFTIPGNYTITCKYIDSLQKCSGTSTRTISVRPAFSIVGPATSCVGCNSVFTTSPTGNFNWSINTSPAVVASGSSNSNTWTPLQTGTFTVTATQIGTTFCNSPQQAVITVAPKPVLSISQSTPTACPGMVVKFWVTSNVPDMNITWTYPVGTQVLNNSGAILDTIYLSFVGSGPYTVTATQKCKYNCSQTSISATVFNPPPPVLASPKDTVCIDEVVNYSVASPVPGVVYTWSITNPNLGTIQSGQGTPNVTILWHGNGTNTGVLRVSHCGGFVQRNIVVRMPLAVSISQSGSCISNGVGYTLTANPGGQTYLWSTGATTQSINTVINPGVYTVTVNPGASGSCPVTKSITIYPDGYEFAIAPPCIVSNCNLSSLNIPLTQMKLNIPCTATLQWFFKPVGGSIFSPIFGATNPNYNATQLGCYKCVATCANGCTITSNVICIPEDIYFCCTSPSCSNITFGIDFTYSGCNPTIFTGFYTGTGSPTGNFPVYYCYGDGTSEELPTHTAAHQYGSAGQYNVCISQKTLVFNASSGTNDTCCVTNCKTIDVPVVAGITASYNCATGILSMNDNSSYYPNSTGATYSWSISGGTYTGILGASPSASVTPTSSGTFIITLSVTKGWCTSTTSIPVYVVIPNAAFTINPNPTCSQGITYFTTTPGFVSYNWQFGDGSFSLATPAMVPQHQYINNTNAPVNFTATLTVVTPGGCTATASQIVSVHPKPKVTVAPNPDTICKGGSVLLTANINPNGNTMCSSYNYQWKNNGVNIPGANASTYLANGYGLYSVFVSSATPSCNCTMQSDTAIISQYPVPVAKILTSSTVCFDPASNPWSFSLSAASVAGYTYNWSSNNGGITFSPNGTGLPFTTATGTLVNNGNFVIYLQVTDSNGCVAMDSLCIYTYKNPIVSIGVTGTLCANSINNIFVNTPNVNNYYNWNNGATRNSISTTLAGLYYVTATDLLTGCSAFSNTISINQSPSLELFPIGCDTICVDSSITIPLAQLPSLSNYYIEWYDGIKPAGTMIYSGIGAVTIPGNFLSLGLHNLWTTVSFPNGCNDSSGIYNVFVKKCCTCNGSSWAFKEFTIDSGATYLPFTCTPQQETVVGCNQITVNAAYNCSPTGCAGLVTGQVLDNLGNVITNIPSLPYTYTPAPGTSGTVFIKLIGWCDGVKCDSCVKMFYYNCPLPEPPCKCDTAFHFNGEPVVVYPLPGDGIVIGNQYPVACGTTHPDTLDCQKNYQFFINYQHPWPSGKCTTMVVGQVLSGGNVIYTQNNITQANPLSYIFPAAGNYCIKFILTVNGVACDSCIICFNVRCNVPCICKQGFNFNGNPVIAANLPYASIKYNTIKCNTSLAKPLMCKTNYNFYISYTNPYMLPCVAKDSAVIVQAGNPVPLVINPNTSIGNPLSYTFTQSGTYCVKHYLTVNGNICDSCIVCFSVECPNPCNCNAFDFITKPTVTFVKGTVRGIPLIETITGECETSMAKSLQCRRQYKFFINAGAVGAEIPAGCVATVNAVLYKNNVAIASLNNVSSTNPLIYTFTTEGIYCIKYELYVNGVLCKTCTLCFMVKCCPIYITLPALKGNFTGCVIGGTTRIFCDSAGGTFTSLDTTIAKVDNNGIVTAVGYGATTIVYTLIKNPCEYYTAATYTVPRLTPLPPIAGNAAICKAGDSIRLTMSGSVGTWISNNPGVANVSTGTLRTGSTVVKGIAAGTATITYNTIQSGCPLTISKEVLVNNVVVNPITGPSGVCLGRTIALSNNTVIPGNFTPQWQSLNTRAIVTNDGIVTGRLAGAATIRYALNYSNPVYGSCSAKADKNISVNILPAVPSIAYTIRPIFVDAATNTLCTNRTFVLRGYPLGGVWNAAGAVNVNANGLVTTTAVGSGTVTYTVYNSSGCSNSRTFTYNVVSCTDFAKSNTMMEKSGDKISLYPNPANNRVYFKVNSNIGEGTMVLSDMHGKELQKIYFKPGVNSFYIGKYAGGMYMVTFKTKHGSTTEKLIKE